MDDLIIAYSKKYPTVSLNGLKRVIYHNVRH